MCFVNGKPTYFGKYDASSNISIRSACLITSSRAFFSTQYYNSLLNFHIRPIKNSVHVVGCLFFAELRRCSDGGNYDAWPTSKRQIYAGIVVNGRQTTRIRRNRLVAGYCIRPVLCMRN